LNGISISGDGTGGNTGNIEVEFNELGIASLDILNYPDAGRLSLSVRAEVEGVTITNSDIESVDVYPSYLALSVEQTELIYSAVGNQNNYVAGENFTFVIGAYGTNDQLLPNYQADTPQLKVTRVAPIGAAENGSFKYSQSSESTTSGTFTTTPNISSSTADDHFVMGEYRFNEAYYTEVGRIELDVKDLDYLGNEIISNGVLTLGDFYPAYFNVALTNTPTLADSCSNTFSYLGQSINFETAPELSLTAYNAIGTKTLNYSDVYWNYLPDETTLETYLSFLDSSTYAKDDSATVIELGDEPVITNNDNYDGSGTVTINNSNFQYNKVNPNDDSVFDPALVSPFEANITLNFASDFFFGNFIDQNGNEDTICYQANHTDSTCLGLDIENVTGTQIRYGRIALLSTYGPETESLNVPIQAEYYNLGQWLVNKEDSCTSIAFDESANHLELLPSGESDITGDISNISSTGMLLIGVADDSGDLFINAPDTVGEVKLQLDPMNDPSGWSDYLNYDWNADGFINADDHPEGTITFGRFRGNDRIIHWREVFN
jgi:MSHA biogenesis protein MshQ